MTAVDVDVVRLRWWHLPQVSALDVEAFGVDAWPGRTWWTEAARPDRHLVVAVPVDGGQVDDGPDARVLGAAVLSLAPPDADVQTLAVAAAARGRGVGRLLLQDLLSAARRVGARRVHLEVAADGAAARGLYASAGFREVRTRRGYYGTDADGRRRDGLDLLLDPLPGVSA